jgi:hypothetical protein
VIRKRAGLKWRECTVPVQKCTAAVDHAFGEAIIKTSKIHNLLMWYPDNIYFSA